MIFSRRERLIALRSHGLSRVIEASDVRCARIRTAKRHAAVRRRGPRFLHRARHLIAVALCAALPSLPSLPSNAAQSALASHTPFDVTRFKPTFVDEFESFTGTPTGGVGRWRTTLPWGDRTLAANKELEYYSDPSVGTDPFVLTSDGLEIHVTAGANAKGLPYNSGVITTENCFSQTYGYFEVDARLPSGFGFWPAFWLLPADHSWPPELDVFEEYGKAPDIASLTAHSAAGGKHEFTFHNVVVSDVTKNYHKFGVDWERDKIRWVIDGEVVFELATPADMHKPMYMVVNVAVTNPIEPAALPGVMSIRSVRAFARTDESR